MAEQWADLMKILTEHPLNAIFLVLGILLLEVILSFDNAAVLATMVKDLPEDQQAKALRYGILGAYLFRGIALVLVEHILEIWWLKPIGGLYLLYMAISHFAKGSQEEIDEEVQDTKKSVLYRSTVGIVGVFWSTVIAVEFMDIVFSIDNIFAVVAYTPNIFIICTGVFIGILAMRYVAKYFVVLMEKYPFLEKSAFLVIGILGLKLCFALVVHFGDMDFTKGHIQLTDLSGKNPIEVVKLSDQRLNKEGDLEINLKKKIHLNHSYKITFVHVSNDMRNTYTMFDHNVFKFENLQTNNVIEFNQNQVIKNQSSNSENLTLLFKNNNKFKWIESEEFDLFVSALTLLIFIIPLLSAKFFQKKN